MILLDSVNFPVLNLIPYTTPPQPVLLDWVQASWHNDLNCLKNYFIWKKPLPWKIHSWASSALHRTTLKLYEVENSLSLSWLVHIPNLGSNPKCFIWDDYPYIGPWRRGYASLLEHLLDIPRFPYLIPSIFSKGQVVGDIKKSQPETLKSHCQSEWTVLTLMPLQSNLSLACAGLFWTCLG